MTICNRIDLSSSDMALLSTTYTICATCVDMMCKLCNLIGAPRRGCFLAPAFNLNRSEGDRLWPMHFLTRP